MIGKAKINGFELVQDSLGLVFKLPTRELIKACEKGDSSIPDNVLKQFVILKMLEEQGLAEPLHNGFAITPDNAVDLDDATREILKLPSAWTGSFNAIIHGLTTLSSFNVDIELIRSSGNKVAYYEMHGPFIFITDTEYYLPTPEQWLVLKSVKEHKESNHDEYNNLLVIYNLKQSMDNGCKIDLHHFSSFKLIKPKTISVTGEILPTGDSILNPYFGENLDFDDVANRLGQLDKGRRVQSLRVGDTFVLLDEKKLKAVHEIINKRRISKNNLQEFLDHPSKFLDATLVDLDLGFSYRVHGATVFKHSYFGETDKKDISWFEEIIEQEKILQPSYIKKLIQSEEELERVATEIRVAINKGATVFPIGDNYIDISNRESVEKALAETNKKSGKDKGSLNTNSEKRNGQTVVDVDLNDTEATFGGDNFNAKLEDILFQDSIDFSYLSRKPFPHQETGIRWFLGLAMEGIEKDPKDAVCGGILADDMGLGKTYITLVGISEYLRICKEKGIIERPVLIVAPKSLLDVWRDEIDKTFTHYPFKDMVTLYGATLNKFKQESSSHETKQPIDNINFSLKVGEPFAAQRLDMPNRLVLTTYETLRNYQFSLCSVDWSVVIFDEAQQIKNPNTIITRAAKGLKACFKLAVTGTPVENSLADFWCLMDTVRPKALGSYQNFRKIFIQPILKAKEEEKAKVRESIGKKLRNCAGALMLRRMKEDKLKGLPKKIVFSGIDDGINQYQEFLQKTMNGKQLHRYNGVMNAVLELQRSGKRGIVLSGLAQLKSLCLHPRLYDKGEALEIPNSRVDAELSLKESGKLEILLDILDKSKKNNEKVIIFLINRRLQSYLKISLDKIYNLQINIINGDTKTVSKRAKKTRKGIIDAFQKSDGFNIIIMSPIAAGTGLTITEANVVVHLERHWNPAKEAQATDRVYRIGQKKDVKVYLPILKHPSKDSFDVNLHKLLLVKSDLKDAVVTPEEVNPDSLFAKTIDSEHDTAKLIRGEDLDNLDPREFEALCAVVFAKELDGESILTPQSNDYAADVYVINGTENVLIECKHKQDGGKYNSIDPITRFHFAKKHYEEELDIKFAKLILASNATSYSFRVKREAKKNGVSLYTKEDLDKLLKKNPITQSEIEMKLIG